TCLLAALVHGDDVFMLQAGSREKLPVEELRHLSGLCIGGARAPEHLNGNSSIEGSIASAIDDAHTPGADYIYHGILADFRYRGLCLFSHTTPELPDPEISGRAKRRLNRIRFLRAGIQPTW